MSGKRLHEYHCFLICDHIYRFLSVTESEPMNSKLWSLCEEQKREIKHQKHETNRLNRELVEVCRSKKKRKINP